MPFTFAHPAIVLPLSRSKYLSFSALVIGSITPDFEYFIKMKLTGRYSHTLEGVFLFDLPVSILLFLIFHLLIKRELIINLPDYCFTRLKPLINFKIGSIGLRGWLSVVLSVLIGIFSHLIWDSFTHKESLLIDSSVFLSQKLKFFGLPQWALYQYLQHISTVVGAAFIIRHFHRLVSDRNLHRNYPNKSMFKYWSIVSVSMLVIFLGRAFVGFEYYGDVIATIIGAFLLGLTIAGSYGISYKLGSRDR